VNAVVEGTGSVQVAFCRPGTHGPRASIAFAEFHG
jgi:hypothetical protein